MMKAVKRAGAMSALPLIAACAPFPMGAVEGVASFRYEATLSSGVATIAAHRAGEPGAPRVILVHGTPGSRRDWTRYLREPMPGLETIAIDRPGFGESTPRGAVTKLADHARALEPLLETRDDKPPILVGWSYGGPVVVQAALMYPERIGGVVVVAGALDPDLEDVKWYQHLGRGLPFLLPRWLRNTNDELHPLEAELRALEPQLAGLSVPVEIVHGTRDGLVPVGNVQYMEDRFPVATQTTLIEGEGHGVVWTSPEVIRGVIRRLTHP